MIITGNFPDHEDGTRLFEQLTTFTMAVPLQLPMDSFKRILDFDPAIYRFNIASVNTK